MEMSGLIKREEQIAALPTGNQAVPITEPDWNYNMAKDTGESTLRLYAKLADIEQGEKETPS